MAKGVEMGMQIALCHKHDFLYDLAASTFRESWVQIWCVFYKYTDIMFINSSPLKRKYCS